jgi:starch phosphorylase
MSKHQCVGKSINSLLPADIEGFDSLAELALDLRSAWNHATDQVWRQLDPVLWELTHNPWVVLQTASRDRIESVLADEVFRKNVDDLVRTRRDAVTAPAWFQQTHPGSPLSCVAYFCMEFMLSEALPIYSGGLENVTGDQLKAASDLGVPVVGVGLLYQQGYFRQVIDKNGAQEALFPYNDPGQLPITPVRQTNGEWLRLEIVLPGCSIWLRAWQIQVGRVTLYLLDSNDAANFPAHRGTGGWRLLRALGIQPDVCHLNEGHAAFAVLERARHFMMRPDGPSMSRWPSRERGMCLPPTRQWPPALTGSLQPSLSNTSVGMQSRNSAYHCMMCWHWAAGTRTTRRNRSTWPIWQSEGAGRSMA